MKAMTIIGDNKIKLNKEKTISKARFTKVEQ
jgi:hypothetical protein